MNVAAPHGVRAGTHGWKLGKHPHGSSCIANCLHHSRCRSVRLRLHQQVRQDRRCFNVMGQVGRSVRFRKIRLKTSRLQPIWTLGRSSSSRRNKSPDAAICPCSAFSATRDDQRTRTSTLDSVDIPFIGNRSRFRRTEAPPDIALRSAGWRTSYSRRLDRHDRRRQPAYVACAFRRRGRGHALNFWISSSAANTDRGQCAPA